MHYFYLQCQYYLHSANREQGLTRVHVLIDETPVENQRLKPDFIFGLPPRKYKLPSLTMMTYHALNLEGIICEFAWSI